MCIYISLISMTNKSVMTFFLSIKYMSVCLNCVAQQMMLRYIIIQCDNKTSAKITVAQGVAVINLHYIVGMFLIYTVHKPLTGFILP